MAKSYFYPSSDIGRHRSIFKTDHPKLITSENPIDQFTDLQLIEAICKRRRLPVLPIAWTDHGFPEGFQVRRIDGQDIDGRASLYMVFNAEGNIHATWNERE